MDCKVDRVTNSQRFIRPLFYVLLILAAAVAVAYRKANILEGRNRVISSVYAEHQANGVPVQVETLASGRLSLSDKTTVRARSSREMVGYVSKAFHHHLRVGLSGSVRVQGEEHTGRITKVATVRDLEPGLFQFRFRLKKPLPKKMLRKPILLTLRTKTISNALTLPLEAIVREEDQTFVWQVESQKAVRQPVGLGLSNGLRVEVRQGLSRGDVVVVAGQRGLMPNQKVQIDRGVK